MPLRNTEPAATSCRIDALASTRSGGPSGAPFKLIVQERAARVQGCPRSARRCAALTRATRSRWLAIVGAPRTMITAYGAGENTEADRVLCRAESPPLPRDYPA